MTAPHNDLRAAFTTVMAGVATPVSVVTTLVDDHPHGTTVSAFASVSMNPPMVLVSLDRASDTLEAVRVSGRLGLNILGAEHSAIAMTFAQKGGASKFAGTAWEVDHGLPRIPSAPGWIACTVASLIDGGDHIVALGNVIAADTCEGAPLVYHRRLFGSYVPHVNDN